MNVYDAFKEYKKDGGIMTFRQYITIFDYLIFNDFLDKGIIKEDMNERFEHKLPNILVGS